MIPVASEELCAQVLADVLTLDELEDIQVALAVDGHGYKDLVNAALDATDRKASMFDFAHICLKAARDTLSKGGEA